MNWQKLAGQLIPVAATATGSAEIQAAGEALERVINAHVDNKAAASGVPRDQILSDAAAQWDKNVNDADALLKEGH